MKQLFSILIAFFLFAGNLSAQADSLLTADFKKDSLGCTGLRAKHVKEIISGNKHTNTFEFFFDGKSIIGSTEQNIISLLGKPNYTSSEVKGIFNKKKLNTLNYCNDTCGNSKPGTSIIIELVDGIAVSSGFIIHD